MISETAVVAFLNDFKEKMKIRDVLFRDDRGKNSKALLELEMRPIERKAILESLQSKDYVEGPLEEKLYRGSDMWVFGKIIKQNEVYIKISMGIAGSSVLCISFQIAEQTLTFPFK
jgi:hypothetical protein